MYDCTRIYQSNALGKDQVAALMEKVNNFLTGKVHSATDAQKANLAAVRPTGYQTNA